jgi:hypothetical protein
MADTRSQGASAGGSCSEEEEMEGDTDETRKKSKGASS